jgi:hypothetical protein
MDDANKITHATKDADGKVAIISGTRCSASWCSDNGCIFPECASFSGEKFSTEKQARQAYPNLEMV